MVGPYPNLFHVEHSSLPTSAKSACASIMSRTGSRAYYDKARDALCFGYEDKHGKPSLLDILIPLVRPGGGPQRFDPVADRYSVDDVVTLIQLAKVDPRIKRKWQEWHETARKSDSRAWADKEVADRMHLLRERSQRRYEQHSMGRHYRGRATVNGLKPT